MGSVGASGPQLPLASSFSVLAVVGERENQKTRRVPWLLLPLVFLFSVLAVAGEKEIRKTLLAPPVESLSFERIAVWGALGSQEVRPRAPRLVFLAVPYVLVQEGSREHWVPRFPPGVRLPFSPSALAAQLASRVVRPLPFGFLKFATKILQRSWTDGKDCCPVAAL